MKTSKKFGDLINYSVYMVNEKMGLVGSPNGEVEQVILTPPKYDIIYPFVKEYAIAKLGNSYGIINKYGEEIISFNQYSFISPNIEEEIFDAYEYGTDRYVRLDYMNNLVEKKDPYDDFKEHIGDLLDINYEKVHDILQVNEIFFFEYNEKRFVYNRSLDKIIYGGNKAILVNDNYLIVKDNNSCKQGIIDINGNTITPYIYDSMFGYDYRAVVHPIIDYIYFPENLLEVTKDGKSGYIDLVGNIKIPFNYNLCGSFEKGYAWVTDFNNKCGLIDTLGNVIEPMVHDVIHILNNGTIVYVDEGRYSKYYVKDKPKDYVKLSWLCASFCFDVFRNSDYVCVTTINGTKGIIRLDGSILLPAIYNNFYMGMEVLNNGVVAQKDYKYGIVDMNNKTLLPFVFDDINTVTIIIGGKELVYYIVEKEYKYGVINNNFKECIPIIYNRIDFKEEYNYFYVETDNGRAMLDYNNDIVIPFTSAYF